MVMLEGYLMMIIIDDWWWWCYVQMMMVASRMSRKWTLKTKCLHQMLTLASTCIRLTAQLRCYHVMNKCLMIAVKVLPQWTVYMSVTVTHLHVKYVSAVWRIHSTLGKRPLFLLSGILQLHCKFHYCYKMSSVVTCISTYNLLSTILFHCCKVYCLLQCI